MAVNNGIGVVAGAPTLRSRYAAFLSYSRAVDSALASALQESLQRMGKPWYRARALRVFRDDTSLSANAGLWPSIAAALDRSEFFILLASPQSMKSAWVSREVAYWLGRNDPQRLLIVVTDGDLTWDSAHGEFDPAATTCIPGPLLRAFNEEPRWVDLRDVRSASELSLRVSAFAEKVADLAAPLHHMDKDEFFGVAAQRHRATRRIVAMTIAAVTVLALAAASAAVLAVRQRRAAEEQRAVAQDQRALAEDQRTIAATRQLRALSEAANAAGDIALAARYSLAAYALRHDNASRGELMQILAGTKVGAVLVDHTSAIDSLAFTPDGRTLASADASGTVLLWDVTRLSHPVQLSTVPTDHAGEASSVAFSPDGATLAIGSTDDSVTLWDVAIPQQPTQLGSYFSATTEGVSSLTFSSDGHLLASGSGAHLVLWDITDRRQPKLAGHLLALSNANDTVTQVAFSHRGRSLAVSTVLGAVQVWDAANASLPTRISEWPAGSGSAVSSLAFSPDDRTLASGGANRAVMLWNLKDGTQPTPYGQPLAGYEGAVSSMAFSPDGTSLATADGNAILMWNIRDPERPLRIVNQLRAHTNFIAAVAYSPDGKTLASGGADNNVVLWDLADRHQPTKLGLPLSAQAIALSPDGRTLAALDHDTVVIWDVSDPTEMTRIAQFPDARIAAFSSDGTTIATGDNAGAIALWDVTNRAQPIPKARILPAYRNGLTELMFSPDDHTLVSVDQSFNLSLWDAVDTDRSQQLNRTLIAGNPLGFSPDGKTLLVRVFSTGGTQLTLWDVSDRTHPVRRGQPLNAYTGIIVSAGEPTLVTTDEESLKVWDLTNPSQPTQTGATIDLSSAPEFTSYSAADRALYIDGELWDTSDLSRPVQVATLPGAGEASFSSDGRRLAVSDRGQTTFWSLASSLVVVDPVELACAISGRELTTAEWSSLLPDQTYRHVCR